MIMFRTFVVEKPLQASKLTAISIALILSIGGFLRIIQPSNLITDPGLADGQLLALVLTPLVSLLLVCVICIETIHTGIRMLQSDLSIRQTLTARPGYALLRLIEAGVAFIGLGLIVIGLRTYVTEPMPAPAGIGLLLAFMAIGLAILIASLLRGLIELYLHQSTA